MRLHVFDLDGTLLKVNASFLFGRYLHRNQYLSNYKALKSTFAYALHKAGVLTLHQLFQTIFDPVFGNRSLPNMQKLSEDCILADFHQWVRPSLLAEFHVAKDKGDKLLLLSSSPDVVVQACGKLCGFDYVQGTCFVYDKEKKFVGINEVFCGQNKKRYVVELANQLAIPLERVIAYSDSCLDLPLLEIVGTPIAVNPDRALLRHSRSQGWQVILA